MVRCDQEKMSTLVTDTHPHTERTQIKLLSRAPAWHKLDMVGKLNATVCTMALMDALLPRLMSGEVKVKDLEIIAGEEA